MEIYDIKVSWILNRVSSNVLGQMEYIKEDIEGINEDIKYVKGNIKENTESIKEDLKDVRMDLKESGESTKEDMKEVKSEIKECAEGIKETVKDAKKDIIESINKVIEENVKNKEKPAQMMENIERDITPNSGVTVLGELCLVDLCITLTCFDECK